MLLNRIWIGFFLVAIVTGLAKLIFWQDVNIFKDMVVEGLFESAKTGFELSIYMTGALCMCLGFMNIGEKGGAVRILSKAISPLFTRVFPNTYTMRRSYKWKAQILFSLIQKALQRPCL